MELKIFFTKQHFRKCFQWFEKVQSWHRIRFGQLVIEARRIDWGAEGTCTTSASPSQTKYENIGRLNQ